jgi:TonB family protein
MLIRRIGAFGVLLALGLLPRVALAESRASAQGAAVPRPLAENEQPPYPEAARAAGVEGSVTFEARVTSEGAVEAVTILTSPRPGLGFEEAVQGGVSHWRFEPARLDGQPVASIYKGTIAYSLDLPYDRARLYPRPSREVWAHVLTLLKDVGFTTDHVDRDAQVVITKWQGVDRSSPSGMPDFNLPSPYAAQRFQLHLFVSPYAEPARVYVGAIVIANNKRADSDWSQKVERQYDRRYYDLRVIEAWILDKLSEKVGAAGQPIPRNVRKRAMLTQSLLTAGSEARCVERLAAGTPPPANGAEISQPKRVEITAVQPVFPGGDLDKGRSAVVRVEGTLMEDGSIWELKALDAGEPDTEFFAAAVHATSLWRFNPTRVDGCPVPAVITVTAKFTLQ